MFLPQPGISLSSSGTPCRDPSRIQAVQRICAEFCPGYAGSHLTFRTVPLANLTKASYNTGLTQQSMNNAFKGNAALFLHNTLEVQS